MKLGGFGFIADYTKIAAAGYDFAELDMPEICELSENEFQHFCDTVAKAQFPILSGARILPITTPLFFVEGFKSTDHKNYLAKSCKRAQILGIQKVILGNGKARSFLSEDDRKNEGVFFDFLRMLAEICGENSQELILEPLGPLYSNYINTIPEAVQIINEVNMPNLFTMADLRHVVRSDEPVEHIVEFIKYIHHIHIDYPTSYPGRNYPKADDDFDYAPFLAAIQKSGYNDAITVEADVPEDWKIAHQQAMEVLGDILA